MDLIHATSFQALKRNQTNVVFTSVISISDGHKSWETHLITVTINHSKKNARVKKKIPETKALWNKRMMAVDVSYAFQSPNKRLSKGYR